MPEVTQVPEFGLRIEGQDASEALREDILQILVEESLTLPCMFTLIINNSFAPGQEEGKFWQHEDLFEIGKSIEISFAPSLTASDMPQPRRQEKVFEGEITAIEANFTEGSQAPIIVRGYDVSHRLHRGRISRSFQNMTDTDIVKTIIQEMGIRAGAIESSSTVHKYIFQENQTNMEFLRERAARNGFELFVQDQKLYFRSPKVNERLSLTWLRDLHSFQVRVSSSEQVSSVEVRGWDYTTKQPIVGTSGRQTVLTETESGEGPKTSSVFFKKGPFSPKMMVVDQPVFTPREATAIAQGIFDELSGEFVHADAKAEGNPKIRPGRMVELQKMGKYSGSYYVAEVRHVLRERGYTTEFSIRGLRGGGDLLSAVYPSVRPRAGQTLLVGIVTNNQDPEGLGRVRVKCPTLTEEHESNWARVVASGAGKSRGFDCLPEVDDEVLVGFEHGNIHRPYVLGGVWNGKDKPSVAVADAVNNGTVRLRTFTTRTGHALQFVEEDGAGSQKGIRLTSVYGHQIYLDDSGKFIEIKTSGGHILKLDDASSKITMKSTAAIDIEAPQNITLKVGTSQITMTPAGLELKSTQTKIAATGPMQVEGAMVNVSASAVASIKAATIQLG